MQQSSTGLIKALERLVRATEGTGFRVTPIHVPAGRLLTFHATSGSTHGTELDKWAGRQQ